MPREARQPGYHERLATIEDALAALLDADDAARLLALRARTMDQLDEADRLRTRIARQRKRLLAQLAALQRGE